MITDDDFTQAMKEAVAERGRDYVYPKNDPEFSPPSFPGVCVYQTSSGSPACIIGVAMDKLGLDLPHHESLNSAKQVLNGTGLSDDAIFAAQTAQIVQDKGRTWGQALDEYLELV